MGTLSSCSTAPMPFGSAMPYGVNAAYGGGYAPAAPTSADPWLAPTPAGVIGGGAIGGDPLAGLAQIVTLLTVAVQNLAATMQAGAGAAQLGQSPLGGGANAAATTTSGGGAAAASGGCGCGCSHGAAGSSKSGAAAPQRRDNTDETPPIPTSSSPRPSAPSRSSESDRIPAALKPKPKDDPAPAPKPAPAPPKSPAPTPPPAPPGSEARILGNGMAFPVKDGKVIQGPHSGGTHGSGPWHDSNALDIEAPEGTPIYAPADGVVSNAKGSNDNPAGRTNGFNMFLEGADNQWFLTHMSKRLVNNGDHIKKGQLIGFVGSANNVPHLHIGQKNGNPADTFKL